MGFSSLIAYVFLLFLRPWEFYPPLSDLQPMNIAAIVCLGATLLDVLRGRAAHLRTPQLYLTLAFVGWAAFSVFLAVHWMGGVIEALQSLLPTLFLFCLVVVNIDSLGKLRVVLFCLAAISVIMAGQGIAAMETGWRADMFVLPGHVAMEDGAAVSYDEDVGAPADVVNNPEVRRAGRIRNLGVLSDPNDLAQVLVGTLPFYFLFARPGRRLRNFVVVHLPVAFVLYATYLTRSRGAAVAIVVLVFVALRRRLGAVGGVVTAAIATMGLLAVGFAAGRSIEGDDSAVGRIDAWLEGIEMLKSSPLWGVGYQQFGEHYPLVAHNSFVHCLAETGLVGYSLWIGLFVVAYMDLRELRKQEEHEGDEGFAAEAAALGDSLVAYLAGAYFLSRTYNPVLFLLVALASALAGIGRHESRLPRFEPVPWACLTGVIVALSIVLLNVSVKVGLLIPRGGPQ